MPVHILVIDDDAMSREVLGLLLEAEGYTVDAVPSGDAALGLLDVPAVSPALILTDMQMPGISGGLLASRLRAACGSGTVLLAMSGSAPAREELEAFDGFLLKPFAMEEIAAALAAHISHPVAESEPAAEETALQSELRAAELDGIPSILNEGIYAQLATSMKSAQLHQLYLLCLGDARKRVALMRAAVSEGDDGRFTREAHAIKGGCGMLGATELYGIAAGLEASGLKARGLHPTADTARSQMGINPLDELLAACDRLERILVTRGVASTL